MRNTLQKKMNRSLKLSQRNFRGVLRHFGVARNYKDRLFIRLLHDKKVLLQLYNALNGTSYTNPDELYITTLEDAVYMGMKNDCSFLIGSYMNLYEHQSTFCPNMPIRGFMYLSEIYQAYIKERDLNVYGTKRILLPAPRYIVFYNGEAEHADVEELRLSDSFMGKDGCIEFTATMYNINIGHNQALMEQCDTLHGYSIFIGKIREFQKSGMNLSEAIDMACNYCIERNILTDFLRKNRSEVKRVLLTEYNEKHQRKLDRADAREEGREEGIKVGREEGRVEGREEGEKEKARRVVLNMLRKGISDEDICELAECEQAFVDEVKKEQ